ncbi:MAG: ABC transporter ATP-binding protein [Synergistaceae bacterium]|nr:ABC transporter ATP-binding protein [Synergistaceae bacterium]
MDTLIEMRGVKKNFGDVVALRDGNFGLQSGEIHSIVGENGAGKSTLMKILYGLYPPDGGNITISGGGHTETLSSLSPKKAISHGIGMVHQEFMLASEMTVLENVILGFEPRKGIGIDRASAIAKIEEYGSAYNLGVRHGAKIRDISVGEAQRVEIIKILYRGANTIILDEPTAVLTPMESAKLFKILLSMKDGGKSIIFISHKLDEVMAISDRITVMRGGAHVSTLDRGKTSIPELARLMVGRDIFLGASPPQARPGKTVLEIDNIWVPGEKELSKLRGVSLGVKSGEILGIAGVNGNGQSELAEAIAGLRPIQRGSVRLLGRAVESDTPLARRRAGMSHIPEDRNITGLNRQTDMKDNFICSSFREAHISSHGLIDRGKAREAARARMETFDVRPCDPDAPAQSLSGGNAQKAVVSREMGYDAPFLLAAQPTRGVDIGSIERIRGELNKARERGTAILLISSDLEEVLALSDRIAVMYEGRITGILDICEANEENVGLLMTGHSAEDARDV